MSGRGTATSIAAYHVARVAHGGCLTHFCACGRATISALSPCWDCEHKELLRLKEAR